MKFLFLLYTIIYKIIIYNNHYIASTIYCLKSIYI